MEPDGEGNNVGELRSMFEDKGTVSGTSGVRGGGGSRRGSKKGGGGGGKLGKCCSSASASFLGCILQFVKGSRFGGIPLAVFYGAFVFYYVTFLLLADPPGKIGESIERVESNFTVGIVEVQCQATAPKKTGAQNGTEAADNEAKDRNYYIGAGIGAGVSATLGVTSIFSVHTRCSMMLIVPGIFAGRGRALMLTAAMGMLIDGPVGSINHNLDQVVNSLTCMYEQMKVMACRYQVQFQSIFQQVGEMLRDAQQIMIQQRDRLAQMANKLTGDLKRQAEQAKRDLDRQLKDLEEKLGAVKKVIEAPGNILNKACSGVTSAVSAAGDFFSDVGTGIADGFSSLFGKRRKKRSSDCGIPPVVPDVDVNVKGIDLTKLKEWIKKLKPDIDLVDLNLDDFGNLLQSQSISDIRLKLIGLIRNVFQLAQAVSVHLKRIFYSVSLVLVVVDAFGYLRKYTSDGQFDNMFVDGNLRRLWSGEEDSDEEEGEKGARGGSAASGGRQREKLTPLRRWELNEKYQVASSFRLSSAEGKRILIIMIPTLLFAALTAFILTADFALASLLDAILQHGKFGISFEGMERRVSLSELFGEVEGGGGKNLASLKLEAFDLSTDPCLPNAVRTDYSQIGILLTIVVISALSCIFDAYACRWRAQICNIFYRDRAAQRAEHLYKRITAGRGHRRFLLKQVILRELERRRNLATFSWWTKIYFRIRQWRDSKKFRCPACGWKVKKEEKVQVTIADGGATVETDICGDCHKEF